MNARSERSDAALLAEWVADARARSLALVADLDDAQVAVPYLPTVNPLMWELGHLAYFQEYWVLRHAAGMAPCRPDVDSLFDSISIGHERRWQMDLPERNAIVDYACTVRDRVLELLARDADLERLRYLLTYSVFHEDMHAEALTITRQALGYPAPAVGVISAPNARARGDAGDWRFAGRVAPIGAPPNAPFVFDNEKWRHQVEVDDFAIARALTTEGEVLEFVEAGGYERPEFWSREGIAWAQACGARAPLYWRQRGQEWEVRCFDRWRPLDPQRAMMNLSFHEAEAYCRFARRRLPTEFEWEIAARETGGERWPLPGAVWEWTSSIFAPYPGFTPDMYHDYSTTSFGGSRRVLRGGSWATQPRMIRQTFRNFYTPDRRDIFAGLRTCAIEA